MKIGVDIMGGDYAPNAVLQGIVLALKELPEEVQILAIGDAALAIDFFEAHPNLVNRCFFFHAPEVIEMGEHPARAYAQKFQSSIATGFRLLHADEIAAFASAGNTGAMLAGSVLTIKTIEGIQRPCILSLLPKRSGGFGILLDVGSNVDCKPEMLYQFGMLGSIYARYVLKIEEPKVALLNIGEEQEKGNNQAQAAFGLMKHSEEFNFVGNVEGRDLWNQKADVIVCDGFTGNIALKLAESFYDIYRKSDMKNDYMDRFNYETYGGTPILGINKTVVVGHGISNDNAIKNMLLLTYQIEKAKLSDKIKIAIQA